jgi:hypothetical protein
MPGVADPGPPDPSPKKPVGSSAKVDPPEAPKKQAALHKFFVKAAKDHPGGAAALIGTVILSASQLFAEECERRRMKAAKALKDAFSAKDDDLRSLFSAKPRRGVKGQLYETACYFIEQKAPAYEVAHGDVDDWARDLVSTFMTARSGALPPAPAADAQAPASAASPPQEQKRSLWPRFLTRRVIQYLCHKWSAGGKHDGWVTAVSLAADITSRLELPSPVSPSTAEVWIRKEKEASQKFRYWY